jgi:hypothetical protein
MPLSFGCQPIQQITVQQNTILAIMNAFTQHHIETDDLAGMDAALEPHTRRLKTLGTYEQRRRRDPPSLPKTRPNLGSQALAVEQASILRCRQPIEEFGFVCSLAQIEQFIAKKDNEIFLDMLRQEAAKQGVAA